MVEAPAPIPVPAPVEPAAPELLDGVLLNPLAENPPDAPAVLENRPAEPNPEPVLTKLVPPPRLSEKVAPAPPLPDTVLDAFEIMLPEAGEFMFEVVISRLPLFPAPVSTPAAFILPVVIKRRPLSPAPVSVDPTVPTVMAWVEFAVVVVAVVLAGGGGGAGGEDSFTATVSLSEWLSPAASVTVTVIGKLPGEVKS